MFKLRIGILFQSVKQSYVPRKKRQAQALFSRKSSFSQAKSVFSGKGLSYFFFPQEWCLTD
jgi:hypothetical protein